jgi:hypothetical protein
MTDPLAAAVREIEQHVASLGWDAPTKLFALVPTSTLLAGQPALAESLAPGGLDVLPEGHLTSVEQEGLPPHDSVLTLLRQIAWPPEVTGAALVVERITLPPEVEPQLPADPDEAQHFAATHPLRREVRLAVGVLRDGQRACALRSREHDADDAVLTGPDLAPDLADALGVTLQG